MPYIFNQWVKKRIPCSGFIILPTTEFVCLFALRIGWLISCLRIGQAPYRDDCRLVQRVGPRLVQSWLFTVLCFSVQMALLKGSKFSCKLLSPNSWNESRLCGVFSEQFVGVLNDQYFNKQATLASTQASRTCTAHNCLQPDWLYLNASQYTVSKCV